MLVRELRRLILFLFPLFLLLYAAIRCFDNQSLVSYYSVRNWVEHVVSTSQISAKNDEQHIITGQDDYREIDNSKGSNVPSEALPDLDYDSSNISASEPSTSDSEDTHLKLYSVSTLDGKFFSIKFGDKPTINPNIIPHPFLEDTWTIVAQQWNLGDTLPTQFVELACDATFNENNTELGCIFPPVPLPIAATGLGKCAGELEYANLNVGPHDARVFHGPGVPFTVYGSNSRETCFGQWMQDFGALVDWKSGYGLGDIDVNAQEQEKETSFRLGTELHRPLPYSPVEKNWFIFWDPDGQMYAHYDIAPRRVFAELGADGSAGPDLAPLAATAGDGRCMARHMPELGPENASIHQATNSLSVTMCRRSDPGCSPDDANTFLFTIFQHKTFVEFHSVYEPYVMVFRRRAPFQVYGISQRPLWIHGRSARSHMLYVTSVSWRTRGQRYHGYLDDVLFLGFGVEDRETAGIDILASDLLAGLGLCAEM
ncbi:hypothetical protein F4804DRAFT_312861 [Jackrogersella minutella]|nr:hypothetical protein F4804DRAFT_312861 [Jackrogersella minutella]